MELAPSRVGASEQVLSADATDPDASPHAQSQESQILCEKCQTLAIEKDKLVRPPDNAWVMELFYERHDAFPDFQELRSAISARCTFCNYLSSILEGIIEKELEGKGRISEIKAKGCFSGSIPFVVKISRWVFWVRNSEEDGVLPSTLEGQISFGTAKKILEFGVSTEAAKYQDMPTYDPLSEKAVGKIRSWLQECASEHDACKIKVTNHSPTRLVDVGDENGCEEPRLIVTAPCNIRYAALSYCWGSSLDMEKFKTTKANVHQKELQIPMNSMPKTLRDAIIVTRALGLQYIWIDCLCIIQDDPGDWESESSKMTQYYEQAHVTVVATAACSADEGFLQNRKTYLLKEILRLWNEKLDQPLHFCFPNYRLGPGDVERSVWNHRGWTMQERLLSRRVLHFANETAWFECRSGFRSDGRLPESFPSLAATWLPQRKTGHLSQEYHSNRKYYNEWYRIASEYSERGLTFPQDKLPAISALARRFAEVLDNDCYLAGLWKQDLLHGIMWLTYWGCRAKRNIERAPSWSWSSIDGGVFWPRYMAGDQNSYGARISISRVEVTPQGQDPMGRVRGGKIVLFGFLAEGPSLLQFRGRKLSEIKFDIEGFSNDTLDCQLSPHTSKNDFWALLVMVGFDFEEEETREDFCFPGERREIISGLILESTGSLNDGLVEYRRVGWFKVPVEGAHQDPRAGFEHAVRREIAII